MYLFFCNLLIFKIDIFEKRIKNKKWPISVWNGLE